MLFFANKCESKIDYLSVSARMLPYNIIKKEKNNI